MGRRCATLTVRLSLWLCPNLGIRRTSNKGHSRAQDFYAAEKAGCSIGGGSTAVGSIGSPLLITGWGSPSTLRASLGLHGARETFFAFCAASDVGYSHYSGRRGYEAFRGRLCAPGVCCSRWISWCERGSTLFG